VERERRARARRRNLAALFGCVAAVVGVALLIGQLTRDEGSAPAAAASEEALLMDAGTFAAGSAPILMYHAISEIPPGSASPELFVPPGDFAAEMAWLSEQGFRAVTLQQLHDAWHGKGNLPPKPVVVSFDDGLQSQFTEALPIMRELGWPGVLNLKVDSLEQGELSEAMVRRMINAGWEIDSHTITHRDVTTLDAAALEEEVADSRKILQERFGVPVDFFCYPAGRYDEDAIAALRDAGYLGATTTEMGLASSTEDPYTLSRVRVDNSDGVTGLAAKLAALGS
jgi:peptidoglycan/xylan/chitin deacetylase (PgdA/CDA1 family)